MNSLLRDTLAERAGSVEPPPLDLDAIVAAGNRRRSRRRALTVLGGAAVTVTGAGMAAAASRKHQVPRPVPAPFVERRVTYALGSEIHYGPDVISVAPHKVTTFVQTDAGFVFLDAKNGIHLADRSGVRSLGKSAWRLTADVRGNLVAWTEEFGDHADSVVYDVATARELVRTSVGNKIPPNASLAYAPRIVALDGNQAYFGTLDGLYRWDIGTNTGELIVKVGADVVRTVTAGQYVFRQPHNRPDGYTLAVATSVNATAPARFTGDQAFLSPTAKYLVTQLDDAVPDIQPRWAEHQFYVLASSGFVSLPIGFVSLPTGYVTQYFGQWLNDTTCTIAAQRADRVVDLLVVDARSGVVRVAIPRLTKLSFSRTPPRTASLALPTGNPLIDLY